jgi:outer membrane protein OmpA-like peptidoglycan-associated protein
MKRTFAHIVLILFFAATGFGRQSFPSDLATARKISVNEIYRFPQSPAGYGNQKEFRLSAARSPYLFKEERNSCWLEFSIPYDGILYFDIAPYRSVDDYDWMLFRATPTLAAEIAEERCSPLRTNNSRNDESIRGLTGIREGFGNHFSRPGLNPGFSSPVEVAAGEKLLLLIDNIYDGGDGFDLDIRLKPIFRDPLVLVEGRVLDKRTRQPLRKASLLLEDRISSYKTDSVTTDAEGRYNLSLPPRRTVTLIASAPGYVYKSELVHLKDTLPVTYDFELDSVQTGKKLTVFNIYFEPNSSGILPASRNELDRLVAFLSREPRYLRVVGHTNNNAFAEARFLQQLSFNRAVAVKRFLVNKGVDEKRISCIGVGGKDPITVTRDPEEALKNLRVDIILGNRVEARN